MRACPRTRGRPAVDAAEVPDVGSAPDASAAPDAGLVPDAGVATEAAERLYQYLSGRFDSAEQAANDQRYFSIQLWICPADARSSVPGSSMSSRLGVTLWPSPTGSAYT